MEPNSGLVRVLKLISNVCSGHGKEEWMARKSAISLAGSAAYTPLASPTIALSTVCPTRH